MKRPVAPTSAGIADKAPLAPPERHIAAGRTSLVLLERDHELDVLTEARRDAAAGDGRLVVVEGAAGIGKTALLASAQRLAADEGFTVLASRASELERQYAFGVVRQLVEVGVAASASWSDGAAAASRPAFESGGGAAPSFDDVSVDVLHGLYWLVLNASSERSLVLLVDDVQWCDRPSLRFLAYLGQRLEGLPVLVLLGLRSGQRVRLDPVLADLIHQPSTMVVQPAPLTGAAAGELLENRLSAAPDQPFSTACHRATGGNPLLLDELARSLRAGEIQPTTANIDAVANLGPRAVSRTVLLRLARLDDDAIAVAQAVAVVGERGDLALLSSMTGLGSDAIEAAARSLTQAEILDPDPPLGFVHPLIRDAVYDELSPLEREARHARAAQLLLAAGRPAEQVAAHALVLPPGSRPWVADVLGEAARLAARHGAAGSAVSYLRRALEEPLPEDQRTTVLLELGVAEAISGDAAAAEEHLRDASAASGDPVVRARALRLLARMLLFTSAPDDAVGVAQAAQRGLPADLVDGRAGLAAIELFAVHFGATSGGDVAERLAQARAGAPTGGPGQRMLTAVASWDSAMRGGTAHDARRLAMEALAGGRLLTEDSGFTTFIAVSTLIIADADETVRLLEELAAARRLSEPQRSAAQLLLGWNWLHRGELVEAEASLRRYLTDTDERGGTLQYGLGYARGFLTRVLIERGKVAEARELAAIPLHVTPSSDPDLQHRRGVIEVLLAEGRWDDAVAAIDDLRTRTRDVVNPAWAPLGSLMARALLGLGRVDEGIEAADAEVLLARRWGAPGALGCSLRALGTTLDAAGSTTCIEVLAEAVEVTEGTPARVEHAKSLLALGSSLRRRGRPGEARMLLRRAADLASICGALLQEERAGAELAAAGGRRTTRAVTGSEALTPSERRVARLAAAGRTNREIAQELFVTPKTVEIHLSSTYRKLGIGSRRDLETAGIG